MKTEVTITIKPEEEKLNLDLTAKEIWGWIRGLSDEPGAFLYLNNQKITADEAQYKLQQLERIAQAKANLKQNKATNDSFLLNANYIKSQAFPSYNVTTATKAFNASCSNFKAF